MLVLIEDDLFGIANRLRDINPEYRVFWNNRAGRFQIHNARTMCFIVPFNELDERTLRYAYETRIENFDALSAEIEKQNQSITAEAERSARRSSCLLADMLHYAASQVHEVKFKKSSKWL